MSSSPIDSSSDAPTVQPLEGIATDDGLTVAQLVQASGLGTFSANGVALEALSPALGTWQYRLAGSDTWLTISVSLLNSQTNTLGLLLGANDTVRLLPFGQLGASLDEAMSLRSWDGSTGVAGEYWVTTPGTEGFGEDLLALTLAPSGVNEAPEFSLYSGSGRRTVSVSSGTDEAFSVLIQPDGKILAAGTATVGSSEDFALVRLNADSTLDGTFDADGRLTLALGAGLDRARSVVMQPDGKILLAGVTHNGVDLDMALVRLLADGTVDTSFGAQGILTLPLGPANDEAAQVIVQPDGRILVIGHSANGTNDDFAIARLLADGTLDASFGSGGVLTVPVGNGLDQARSAALQADGKVVLVGRSWNGSNDDFAIVRLNSDGTLDASFDVDGKRVLPFGANTDDASSVAIQSDGKILVGGTSWNGGSFDFAIARLNIDGSLDTSFDADGKSIVPMGSSRDDARSMVLQSDGKILIAGRAWNGLNYDFAIARLNTDGSLDSTFDGDGKRVLAVGSNWDEAHTLAIAPDGRILLAGRAWNGTSYDFAFVRLNPDGSLDTSFNGSAQHTLGGTVQFTENSAPITLDASVSVIDPELSVLSSWAGNYGGASITIARQGEPSADDVFSGRGALSFIEGQVLLSGLAVGSVSQTDGVLSITFADGTTQAQVNAVLSSIGYVNANDVPPESVSLLWTFSDGNTGEQGSGETLSATGITTVLITAANDAPTGTVLIQGELREHETVWADVSGIDDPEGLGEFSYAWYADDESIGSSADSTLLIQSDLIGKQLRVEVRYTDGEGSQERVSSTTSAVVTNVNDAPAGQVLIAGLPLQGETLVADVSEIQDPDGLGEFSYQWLADGMDIEGATQDSLLLTQAWVGQSIAVVVRYTDAYGTEELLISEATPAIDNLNDPASGEIRIEGDLVQGQTLIADVSALQDPDGLGEFSYQWHADGVDIEQATDSTLTLGQDLVGARISLTVHFVDARGASESVTSEPTMAVANENDGVGGVVLIDGVPIQNGTLFADTSDLDDPDGMGEFSYQWLADGAPIEGATHAMLELTQALVGQRIGVVVSYIDAFGTTESVQSDETDPVDNVNDAVLGEVVILGTAAQYETLSLDLTALDDLDGLGELSIQWLADDQAIDGATQDTLLLSQAHVGARISAVVHYTDGFGAAEWVASDETNRVEDVNDAPVLVEALPDLWVDEDADFIFDIPAGTFADQDPEDRLDLEASLADGEDLPEWLSFDPEQGRLEGTPSNADVGTITVRIRASDRDGESVFTDFTLNVRNVNDAPVASEPLGEMSVMALSVLAMNLPETLFTDVDADASLSYEVTLEDGSTLPEWLSFDAEHLTLHGTPDYSDIGRLRLKVTATDEMGDSASSEFDLSVQAPPGLLLEGGSGADTLDGSRSGDTLLGWAGNDSLDGNDGDDLLDGGLGHDRMAGGAGDDVYIVDAAADQVIEMANDGLDTVQTALLSFVLPTHVEALVYLGASGFTGTGNGSDNAIAGGAGADRLLGLAGQDTLLGGLGNDSLTGGQGADRLTGGAGADRFIYLAPSDSRVQADQRDLITDFEKGIDRIDLSMLDANGTISGNQAFVWRGTAEFSAAGQVRMWYDAAADQTLLEANTDANRSTVELSIALIGNHTQGSLALQATDIVL